MLDTRKAKLLKGDLNIRVSYYYIRFQTKHIPKWAREHLGKVRCKMDSGTWTPYIS